jgi:hypothetical protein
MCLVAVDSNLYEYPTFHVIILRVTLFLGKYSYFCTIHHLPSPPQSFVWLPHRPSTYLICHINNTNQCIPLFPIRKIVAVQNNRNNCVNQRRLYSSMTQGNSAYVQNGGTNLCFYASMCSAICDPGVVSQSIRARNIDVTACVLTQGADFLLSISSGLFENAE